MVLRDAVTFRRAAKILGTSVATIEQLVFTLELLTIEVHGKTLIPPSELRRFMPRKAAA